MENNGDVNSSRGFSLNEKEIKDIEHKVDFELNEMQLKMIKIGGLTNIIGGNLVPWVLYNQISLYYVFTWYAILVLVNIINIIFSFSFQYAKVTPDKIDPWLKMYHLIFMPPVCLVWGSIGVLFIATDLQHQFYILVLLFAVALSFSIGTITDIRACIISVSGILLPTIIYRLYAGIYSLHTTGQDPGLNLAISVCMLILATFMLIACFIGYRLIRRSFKLTYINVALKNELENINQFLEQRVQERTQELEDSLKVVTYQATHDLLTDLPNQRLLLDYLDSAIVSATQNAHQFAVVVLSLNELDKIIDGLGHEAGDFVIKTIAERFKKKFSMPIVKTSHTIKYTVTLSRKDVFDILINPIYKLTEMEEDVRALFSLLDEPISFEKQSLKLTASIGVSVYPKDGRNTKTLLINAGLAMFQAKKHGGNNINLYTIENNIDISKQLELESSLHNAVKNNEFILHYQPVVNLKSGKISSLEALVRWHHPKYGLIYPNKFIPLAEADGIIIPLGELVLQAASAQLKKWHTQGFQDLKVAINLSSKQLLKKNIVNRTTSILKEINLDPKYIELELTESAAFQDYTIPILKQFKNLGFGLAIDDFGTGYSGLSNLKLFAIDTIKIDKSFIDDINTNEDSKAIVINTISLAKKINVAILAEGVETKEQLAFLQEQGCDLIQGYYFSRPIPAEEVSHFLTNFNY